MKTQKLSPKDCKNIYQRSKAGETQAAIAVAYGVSQQLVSRVVKREREKQKTAQENAKEVVRVDHSFYASWTPEQMTNRYGEIWREIREIRREKIARQEMIAEIQSKIPKSYKKLEAEGRSPAELQFEARDAQSQIVFYSRQAHIDRQLRERLQELSEIISEFLARGMTVPVG